MSTGSLFGMFGMLVVVLALMGVALRMLRRYTMGGAALRGAVRMEVLQRVTLGQRQGLAVVRVGSRILAVSMGDGGVHPVAELDETDLALAASERGESAGAAALSLVPSALRKLSFLRAPKTDAQDTPERISYVAPMEDFQAVLSMALGGQRPALGVAHS